MIDVLVKSATTHTKLLTVATNFKVSPCYKRLSVVGM